MTYSLFLHPLHLRRMRQSIPFLRVFLLHLSMGGERLDRSGQEKGLAPISFLNYLVLLPQRPFPQYHDRIF